MTAATSTTTGERFQKLLDAGRDSALLRFALANECMKNGNAQAAVDHLRRAVALDAGYSAAWKLLGQALTASGALIEARDAYEKGMATASAKGDQQALKEMQVFSRRLAKQLAASDETTKR